MRSVAIFQVVNRKGIAMIRIVRKLVQDGIRKATGYSWMIVPSSSMEPTLLPGDLLIVREKERYIFKDIVVFTDPEDKYNYLVKRVMGVPGDTVYARRRKLYRNEVELDEPYIKEPVNYLLPRILLSNGVFFVLGDNRNNSDDCSISMQGISGSRIVGVVVRVIRLSRYLGWLFKR